MITQTTSTTIRRDSRESFFTNMNAQLGQFPLSAFVTDYTSDRISLISGWFGAVASPSVRSGPVNHRDIKNYAFTVTPQIWDNTQDIDISTMEDAQAVGVATDIAGKIGQKNARHRALRATQVLELGTGTTVSAGYDAVSLFNDNHPESGTNQDNNFTSAAATGTTPTAAELESAYTADRPIMSAYTDDQGDVYDLDESNFTIMGPLAFEAPLAKVLALNGTIGGLGNGANPMGAQSTDANDTLPTGVYRGTMGYFLNPLMTNSDRMYMLRRPRAGNASVLIFNMRSPWRVLVKDPTNSDYALDNDCIVFSSKARYEVNPGDWRSAAVHVFT